MKQRDLWEYDRSAYERRRGTREETRRDRNTLLFVYAVIVWALATVILFTLSQTEEPQETPEPVVASPATVILEPPVYLDSGVVHREAQEPAQEPFYAPEDLEALALVIYQEAGGDACSNDTRQMVGEVVLNRVADERFPDTIREVLTEPRQYGRLHWTGLVWPDRAEHEAEAVERAYACAEALLSGAERLLPEDAVWQAEFPQGEEVLAERDGLYFCR